MNYFQRNRRKPGDAKPAGALMIHSRNFDKAGVTVNGLPLGGPN